jgi:hypothetical protein
MQSSIYCSGYSEATCATDLRDLFSKMVRVQSVFEPGPTPTGLKRNFMIIKVIAEEGEVAKCIKKLNNCFWKGGTLCVEKSNEHYDVRIDREHHEEEEEDKKLRLEREDEASQPLPTFDRDHVRLKKAIGERGVGQHVYVSTEQLMRKSNEQAYIMRGDNKTAVLSCGRRLVFEYHDDGSMTERKVDTWGNDIVEGEKEEGATNKESVIAENLQLEEPSGRPVAPAAAALSAGSGVRKGFGTLLPQLKVAKASTKESAVEFQRVMDDADSHFAGTKGSGGVTGRDINDLIQENEFNEEDMLEIVRDEGQEDIHVPSATAEELQEGELAGARNKALQLAMALLDTEGGTPGADGDATGARAGVPKKERVYKSGWDSTTIGHFDPSNEASAALYLMDDAETEATIRAARARQEEKDAARREKDRERGISNDKDLRGGGNGAEAEASEADLAKLKNIFSKDDGGVWFGNTGTDLKTEAIKGDAKADKIFMEAEKFGFDVRDGAAGGDKSGMTFGFFDDGAAPGAKESTTLPLSSPSLQASEQPAETERPSSSSTLPSDEAEKEGAPIGEMHEVSLSPSGESAAPASTPKVFSLLEVVHQAKRFRRSDQSSAEQLVREWQASRDKLSLDYRRRRKDTKRRMDRYNIQNHRFNVTSSPAGHGQGYGYSAGGRSKQTRGGKKHRKAGQK